MSTNANILIHLILKYLRTPQHKSIPKINIKINGKTLEKVQEKPKFKKKLSTFTKR